MSNLQQVIEAAFEKRAEITPKTVDAQTRAAIEEVIEGLDSGKYRVAEKIDGEWITHQWLKKAVLLSFRINDNQIIDGAETKYYDKVALKFADYTEERFAQEGFRVVPSATRYLPLSSPSITSSIAARVCASTVLGVISARFSNAASIICCKFDILLPIVDVK